jgi:HEAT repeat protein
MWSEEAYKSPSATSSLPGHRRCASPSSRMRSWSAAFVVAIVVAGCGDASKPASELPKASGAYTATIDVSPLIRQLGADETFDADEAAERLGHLGDAILPVLDRALAAETRAVRLGIVETLSQIDSEGARARLARVAREDADAEVRATALLDLGQSGDAAARPALEAALDDPAAVVTETAAIACGGICTSPAAIDRMLEIAFGSLPDAEVSRMRAGFARTLSGGDHEAAQHARTSIEARATAVLASDAPLDHRVRGAIFGSVADVPGSEALLAEASRTLASTVLRTAAADALAAKRPRAASR